MTDLEGSFYDYLHETARVNEDWNREVLRFYCPYFADSTSALDVGCGQGQFMELLEAGGIPVQGVDIDARMVQLCKSKGLQVAEADLFVYLAEHEGQFGGIFSSNVIEHLSAPAALRFIELAYAALQPGGLLLLATPNPESLVVHLYEFWRDATHIRLYSNALLEFLLHTSGFRNLESGGNPRTIWQANPDFAKIPELWTTQTSSVGTEPWRDLLELLAPSENDSWKRRLRRRLARFLVKTVMYEEFSALIDSFQRLDERHMQLRRTTSATVRELHTSQSTLLTVPREIFVVGRKLETN